MNKQLKKKQNIKQPTTLGTPEVVGWLGWERWFDFYKPIRNKALQGEAPPYACVFETFGSELARVKATPENKVWTWVDEGRHQLLYSGYHLVNRFGYFICKVPWEVRGLVVIYKTDRFVSTETELPEQVAQTEKWKLELGARYNRLLSLAEKLEESSKSWDLRCADDLRSIIERVADFEKLETE